MTIITTSNSNPLPGAVEVVDEITETKRLSEIVCDISKSYPERRQALSELNQLEEYEVDKIVTDDDVDSYFYLFSTAYKKSS